MSFYKELFLPCLLFFTLSTAGQQSTFPQSWLGNWKGELLWYKTGKPEPQKVNMELRIQPGDSAGTFTWQLIYGTANEDNRPYTLLPKDTTKAHWVIDENNGIVLDQFLVGNKFCGSFTVQNATILNNYWLDDGKMYVEFFSYTGKPLTTTGKGNEESPFVDSYRITGYQKAVLQRTK